jgi:hypothetical protein
MKKLLLVLILPVLFLSCQDKKVKTSYIEKQVKESIIKKLQEDPDTKDFKVIRVGLVLDDESKTDNYTILKYKGFVDYYHINPIRKDSIKIRYDLTAQYDGEGILWETSPYPSLYY